MDEKLYQNIDIPQNNPLDIGNNLPDVSEKKPLNPKIILLIILVVIIFVLLILSLIVTKTKKKQIPATPTSAPVIALPTTNDSLIPTQYQESFKNLEKSFEMDPDLPVPQIDTTVGE